MPTEMRVEPFGGRVTPFYYAPKLVVGNGRKDVAICTLWTKEDVLNRVLSNQDFGLRGPLFSQRGAEYIIRNVLANPVIRSILIVGADANNSPAGLLALKENGVGDRNEIKGLVDETGKPRVYIDPGLPVEAVDRFREEVTVEDMRDERNWDKVSKRVAEMPQRPAFDTMRRFYPESLPATSTLQSEGMGIRIGRNRIADAWVDMLFHIRKFGVVKPSDKGRDLQELPSLHVVVNETVDGLLDRIPNWLPVSRRDIEEYLPVMLESKPRSGVDTAYTYGAQLRNYDGLNQLEQIGELMKGEWYTKRAVAMTWHLPDHLTDQVMSAPCLVDLMFLVQDDRLMMTAHFRSHDMYRAWLQNVYGLRFLQAEMAKKVGVGLGQMEVISNSAHLWQDIISDADRIVAERYPQLAAAWREDPRGNFLVSVEGEQIVMKHVDTFGNPTGMVFRGTSGQQLYKDVILNEGLISLPDHAAYLAWEIGMAAQALATGSAYQQDRA